MTFKLSSKLPSIAFFQRLVLGLAAATLLLCRWQPIYWEDVWSHLGVGNYILAHRMIPRADVFSWTAYGAKWINIEWLYEVLLAGIVRIMGLPGVSLVKNVLVLLSMIWVDRRLRFWGAGVLERVAFVGVVFLGGWPFWVERADLSSLALFSWLFWEIDRTDNSEGWTQRCWWKWAVLCAFWANLHGQFTFGLFVLALHALSLIWTGRTRALPALFGIGLCLAATLLNPNGIGLHVGILRSMNSTVSDVYEWMAPSGWGYLFFDLSIVLAVISFGFWRRYGRSLAFSSVIMVSFGLFACRHARFVPFFMVGAFPYAAAGWLQTRRRSGLVARLARYERFALLFASILLCWTSVLAARSIRGGIDADSSGYIKRACDFIEQKGIRGPFYNEYKFGSYWIYRFQGSPAVFQDGRYAVVKGYDLLINRVNQAKGSAESWTGILNEFGIQAAVVRYPVYAPGVHESVLIRYFPPNHWALVYWDDQCLIFARRHAKNEALIRDGEFRSLKPDWSRETFVSRLIGKGSDLKGMRSDLRRALALQPDGKRVWGFVHAFEAKEGT